MTSGKPYMVRTMAGLTRPKQRVPGADLAGVVEEVGEGVSAFQVGDEVFGESGSRALAEYVMVKETYLARKPPNVGFEAAAATPMAGMTAVQGLRDIGGLVPGGRVLINGASGGVGTFAVQIAKAMGAEVTAVCSTAKVEMVRSLGADKVIDYTVDDYTESERGYDVLFDNVGDRPWSETSRVLVEGGVDVVVTGPKHSWLGPLRHMIFRKVASKVGDKRLTWFTARIDKADLEFLAGLLESGKLKPVVEKVYPLEQTAEALRYLSEGHARGKLVIRI